MHSQRLFEIIYLLLDVKKTTAQSLADRFGVSIRTIYRDLDALTLAGIPIVTDKGRYGGISLLQNYVLDKRLFSSDEMKSILASMSSLSALKEQDTAETLQRLKTFFSQGTIKEWIQVDFSDWSDDHSQDFALLKAAILQEKWLTFDYYSTQGNKSNRTVLPLQLWFKSKSWYCKAYCSTRKELRLFKITRMVNISFSNTSYSFDSVRIDLDNLLDQPMELLTYRLQIDQSQAYRVYDEFNKERIARCENGDFMVVSSVVYDEWLIGYILSFGSRAKVIEPPELAERIKQEAIKLTQRCQE